MGKLSAYVLGVLLDIYDGRLTAEQALEREFKGAGRLREWTDRQRLDLAMDVECAMHLLKLKKITPACKAIAKFRKMSWQSVYKRHAEAKRWARLIDRHRAEDFKTWLNGKASLVDDDKTKLARFLRNYRV